MSIWILKSPERITGNVLRKGKEKKGEETKGGVGGEGLKGVTGNFSMTMRSS